MIRLLLSLVALLLLSASSATAEPSRGPIRVALTAYVTASAADAVTTGLVLHRGTGREANPIFQPLGGHPVALGAVRMGAAAALAYGLHRAYPAHPRLTLAVAWIAAGSVSVIAVRNARVS